jgi:hypothetical protein
MLANVRSALGRDIFIKLETDVLFYVFRQAVA